MKILAVVLCSVASVWIWFLSQYWTVCTTFRSKKKIIVSSLFDWKIAEVLLSRWGFLKFLDSGILKKKVFTDKSPPCFLVLNFKWMYVFHNQSFRKKKRLKYEYKFNDGWTDRQKDESQHLIKNNERYNFF